MDAPLSNKRFRDGRKFAALEAIFMKELLKLLLVECVLSARLPKLGRAKHTPTFIDDRSEQARQACAA